MNDDLTVGELLELLKDEDPETKIAFNSEAGWTDLVSIIKRGRTGEDELDTITFALDSYLEPQKREHLLYKNH